MENNLKPCFVMLEPITPKQSLALSAELRNVINERNMLTSKSKKKFLSALEAINSFDVESKRKSCKNKAVQEILDTELSYLKQLETIQTFFMKPLRGKKIIKDDEFFTIFGSIDSLYKINGELLNELKVDLMNVAQAFSKLAPFFKMYSIYAYNYTKCLSLLENLYRSNKEFAKFISAQETRPEVQNKLSSLLITPIQRIPRYGLLLQQVADNTLPTDADYEVLQESLCKLEEVARHVNSLVEERENSQRLLELMRTFRGGRSLIIKAGRKLIKEGPVKHYINSKANQKVYLVLMSDVLMICKYRKPDITLPKSLKCEIIYPLHKCTVTNNKTTMMFEISCLDHSMVFYHNKYSESEEWIRVLNKSIDNLVRNRSTLQKGNSERRPAFKSNLESYKDPGVSPGVRRVLKRRRTDEEPAETSEATREKMRKFDFGRASVPKSIFPGWRVSSRQSIRKSLDGGQAEEKSDSKMIQNDRQDALFPLREHFKSTNSITSNDNSMELDSVKNSDVFVFGQTDNRNRGFSFGIGSIFTGIGNSVKRVFGFN